MQNQDIRNIAIIAHVDHGKTTLVDCLLRQSGTLDLRKDHQERIMDSNDLERERGITILAKNTAISYKGQRINIVDTPGHADFGGEVERILSMVDSVLLIVDAVEGPMPQTRFVTQKAFKHGLKPIVVINKVDRVGARVDWVLEKIFELFIDLDASDEQVDFPVVYASAINGFATLDLEKTSEDMTPLFEALIEHVPKAERKLDGPLQLQISSLDYSSYVGAIGIGRVTRGKIRPNMLVSIIDREGNTRNGKVLQVLGYMGLERTEMPEAASGDIIAITGIEGIRISDTICERNNIEALPALEVDEPTMSMNFLINNSPFAGKEGKYVTSRKISERLDQELIHNVALRVEQTDESEKFKVSGRGELHLAILIETMRREGYEFAVSRPEVVIKEINGEMCEPMEKLTADIPQEYQGAVMQALGDRRGQLQDMQPDARGRVRLDYEITARGLIGFYMDFTSMTSGTGLLYHVFDRFVPIVSEKVGKRAKGVLISNGVGKATAYSLYNIQDRGKLFIGPQAEVYEGMIVGEHTRDNDLVVNVIKPKALTNMRASGSDENIILTPPLIFTLEQAMAYINDDELIEITPKSIRLRKKFLKEHERKRTS
ncbi:MAG: translational GTPase TypA [Gammaproteobacteria bacterium]|nr:translational GTPase TypA [Gammaproteobacteria bacterium]